MTHFMGFLWVFVIGLLMPAGCNTDCGCANDESTASSSDGDADADADTDADSDIALGSFCNPISYSDGTPAPITLVIGQGTSSVSLFATSQTCSNRLGQPCAQIPVGISVPLVLRDENGTTLFETTADFSAGESYAFFTNVDPSAKVVLDVGTLGSGSNCANMECSRKFYNALTCAPSDPCAMAADGYCDNTGCMQSVPNGTAILDDAVDCSL